MNKWLDHEHGTRGRYGKGCRCDECREAAAKYHRDLQIRKGRPVRHVPRHGTWSRYTNKGCRCVPCKTAAAKRVRESSWRKNAQEWIDQQKRSWCLDCGYINIEHPETMDFDHRPDETKSGHVGHMAFAASRAKAAQEILKCDLVCSNCHRIRTRQRRREKWKKKETVYLDAVQNGDGVTYSAEAP